jgi:hypothetical protein
MATFVGPGPFPAVASDIHRQAMDALRRQQDRDAIAEGLAQMELGQGQPLDEAFAAMRASY